MSPMYKMSHGDYLKFGVLWVGLIPGKRVMVDG